jgi:transposase
VRNELTADPFSGDVYVFFNRSRRTVKMLVWGRDGLVLYSKRLEHGCYEQLIGIIDGKSQHISYQHLVTLLSGILLADLNQRPRYEIKKQDNIIILIFYKRSKSDYLI